VIDVLIALVADYAVCSRAVSARTCYSESGGRLAPPRPARRSLLRLGGERSKFAISEFRVRGTHRAFDVCGSSPSHLSTQERGEGAHLSCCEIKTLSPCYRGVSRETGDELPTSAESSASHTASDKAVGCENCFHLLGCFT